MSNTEAVFKVEDQIVMEVNERVDAFVFKVLQPYCNYVSEHSVVDKHDLAKALQNMNRLKAQPVKDVQESERLKDYITGHCPVCGHYISTYTKPEDLVRFCKYCGQAVKWSDPNA